MKNSSVIRRRLVLAVTALVAALWLPALRAFDDDPLVGLWSAERAFASGVRGQLDISRSGAGWQAHLDGQEVEIDEIDETDERSVRLTVRGDGGSFRGDITAHGNIEGHWIQPTSPGFSYPHATPMVMLRQRDGSWRGQVEPLGDRLSFYLDIAHLRSPGTGTSRLIGLIRNPERNLGPRMRFDRVVRDGDRVEFRRDPNHLVAKGEYNRATDTLRMLMIDYETELDFRRDPGARSAFLPSVEEAPYRYRVPHATPGVAGRGWQVGHARDVGLDPQRLAAFVEHLRRLDVTSTSSTYIHTVVIARQGKLVLEESFYGQGPMDLHDTRSAGKSVASMLVGAGADRLPRFDAKTRLTEVWKERSPEPELTDRSPASHAQRVAWRNRLNVGHLLSMSSGLDCDDDDGDSLGNEGRMQNGDDAGPDWVAWGLGLAMVKAPGGDGIYCSNSINLAAATLSRVSGLWLPDAFSEWLAKPLGIERYAFNLTPAGDGYMGGGIRLRPRDQAKFGQLILDRGMWRGERVLSEQWVDQSTSAQTGINEPNDYGYAWWRTELPRVAGAAEGAAKVEAIYASGNGGQLVIVVPKLELVVQFSAGNYGQGRIWSRYLHDLVPEFVFPALLGAEPEASAPAR